MSAVIVYRPGMVFAMLMLQVMSAKSAIPFVGVPDDDDDDACDDGCITSHGMMHGTRSVASTSSRSSASSISSASQTSPASSSSTVTATVIHRPKITTAGIIGATLGSLIVVGLLLMILAKYRNRARKARKRPVGFASVFPHFSAAEQTNTPDTEMSQSQSSPLIPPAGASAARVAPDSAPPYRHSHSFYGEDRTIDPFFPPYSTPGVPPHHSDVVEGSPSSNEHTRSDASSGHEPLQSPYETGFPPLAMVGVLPHDAGFLPSSFPPEPSGLHHEMATFQKALEGDAKGIDAQVTRQTSQLETRGSPPKYHG